jgi:hypothetical protein
MEYINEHIINHFFTYNIYLFTSFLILSTCLGKKLLIKYKEKYKIKFNINNALYFALHFIFNIYSVCYDYENIILTFNNPLIIRKTPNNLSFYVFLFHLYHVILCGKKISYDEIIHHALVFILSPLLWIYYTNLCDFAIFFMSGLPGGITYLFLFLKNIGIIEGITEKYISKHLNMWVRAPGCIITAYLIYINYINNNFGDIYLLKTIAIYLSITFNLWNGMYFASTIIESYKLNTLEKINKNQPYNLKKFTFIVDKISHLMDKLVFSKEIIDNYKQKFTFSNEWINNNFKKKIFKDKKIDNYIDGKSKSRKSTTHE